jgi:hypothetical protein
MTFLAKCVFSVANNLEQELNIAGILLEICSKCVCCPGQSINIWFLSDSGVKQPDLVSPQHFFSLGHLLCCLFMIV